MQSPSIKLQAAYGNGNEKRFSFPPTTEFDFELPRLVESVRQGRISTHTLAAIVTTLFSVMEVTFLSATDPPTELSVSSSSFLDRGTPPTRHFFLIVSYAALILNLSATISSVFLVDTLGALAFERKTAPSDVPRTGRRLLRSFGAAKTPSSLAEWHWFISFNLGVICIFCQLMTYIWLHETKLIGILMSLVVAYAVLPFLFTFM